MAGVPLAALAALGGTYPSSVLPLLAAAVAAFFVSGAVVAGRGTVAIDLWLLAMGAAVATQLVPLPPAVTAGLSPKAGDLQSMLSLGPVAAWRPLAIDARLTREGLQSLVSAILVFWAVRAMCGRGGLRVIMRSLAAGGFLIAIVAVAQRATAPTLIWWTWTGSRGTLPFGPFVNRNHFAAWLLMATAAAAGYTLARLHSHHGSVRSRRQLLRDLLVEGTTLLLAASVVTMTLTLFATTSRGALLGFGVALCTGLALSKRGARGVTRASWVLGSAAIVVAAAVWMNADALSQRLVAGSPVSRLTIWRETVPILRDFPLTGTGIGTYAQAMLWYQRTNREVLFNQAHSEYVQLASEGGLLVAIPALGAAVTWLILATRRIRAERQGALWIRIGAAAGIAGVAIQSVWESPIRMTANAMLLATLAAVVIHQRESRGDTPAID